MSMSPARFKATRESIGLTSKELAQLFGIRQSSVTRMEAGIRPIPERRSKQLDHLVDQFDADIERLRTSEDKVLIVPRNDAERTDMSRPARWQRLAALEAARQTGKQIRYNAPEGRND